ncbi:histidine kinase [Solimonas fluminis]|uniref:Signal transduction histidine-protein kinase/phosphatase MprB n=1 Tax=Solimonas fluminis TaxID=2086571 RepID=A0A2S5TJZ2_9GAMM|nr:HAMP domain-containing sensor histidine kinase [Solimonas fluminis]PPE75262.1 histidine kinase [Solimonas fluminis]
MKKWFRLRLRSILLLTNLVILALPLGGIIWLRLYESALIRQTESELIAQAAFVAASYRATAERLTAPDSGDPIAANRALEDYGYVLVAAPKGRDPNEHWRPRAPVLDLAEDRVLPTAPPPEPGADNADPLAWRIGQELNPILQQAQRTTLAGIAVVDYRGVVVASTRDRDEDDLGLSLTNHEEVRRALGGEAVSSLRARRNDQPAPPLDSISRGARLRVYVAEPILREGRVLGAVLLVRTPANLRQAIEGKRQPLILAGLALLGLVLALTLFSALTISRPVRQLVEQAHRAARGETGAVTPLAHPGTQEIAELSETVAAMARTLEQRAQYIRDFAAHVSHEFKTPLTAIQGSVELLREHGADMSAAERTRFLDILNQDAQRLENLVRKLLELARADVMRVGDESCELAAVLAGVAQRQQALGLRVQPPAREDSVTVAMAAETLDSILGNLLDNARHHGGAGVSARLDWAVDGGAAPCAVITVADDGQGISAANAERIFEPFFTTRRQSGNTGLGLAIIRSLLTAHGGGIELAPAERGACFRVRVPLKG